MLAFRARKRCSLSANPHGKPSARTAAEETKRMASQGRRSNKTKRMTSQGRRSNRRSDEAPEAGGGNALFKGTDGTAEEKQRLTSRGGRRKRRRGDEVTGDEEAEPPRKTKQLPAAGAPAALSTVVARPLSTLNVLVSEGAQQQQEGAGFASVSVRSLLEREAIATAIRHLKESDPKLRAVIETEELPSFEICSSPFCSLVRSIVYQQLGIHAAAAIYKRVVTLCGDEASVTPATILRLPSSELRSIGISLRKASYLHDLARNFTDGDLSDAAVLLMEDGRLMSSLTAVKGIGTWSVHMFMIFSLHRPDVLPVGDLGVRKGFQKLYNLKSLPTATEMEQLAAPWRPYRSLGSWYMWRVIGAKAWVPPTPQVAD